MVRCTPMRRLWLLIGALWACDGGEPVEQQPVPVQKPGFVTIKGRLVDAAGNGISEYRELYGAEFAPYLDRTAGEPARVLIGDITDNKRMKHRDTVTTDKGKFTTKVPPDSRLLLRTDFVGARLRPQRLEIERENIEPAITATRVPFLLYGEVRDKKTGELITDHVTVEGGDRHASTLTGRYALHFDTKTSVELSIKSQARRHLDQTATVTLDEADTRHDIVLAPLSEAEGAVTVTVNVAGETPTKDHKLWVKLEAPGFSNRVEVKATPFELTVPKVGEYSVSSHADELHLELPQTLSFTENKAITAKLLPRDTDVLVILKVESGKALGFADPAPKKKDEPATNCVTLERKGVKPDGIISVEPGAAGECLRPDRRGHVEFAVHEGGRYTVRTSFNGYKDRVKKVDVKPHTKEKVYLILEAEG